MATNTFSIALAILAVITAVVDLAREASEK